jgi:hypothetical protein
VYLVAVAVETKDYLSLEAAVSYYAAPIADEA